MSRRVILLPSVLFALLIGAAFYGLYIGRASLLKLDGTIVTNGIQGHINVTFDGEGIPQTYAATREEAYFVLAFITLATVCFKCICWAAQCWKARGDTWPRRSGVG